MRLDQALVQRGMARSRSRAAQLIAQGNVLVNAVPATKASQPIMSNDQLRILEQDDFASRAAFKLLRTLEAIGCQDQLVAGKKALDVGASTGGFTDVLLRHGAQKVIALDVGHDQLIDTIRLDPRVHVIEGYNARDLVASDLPYAPELIVSDVSFISLTLLIPALARTIVPGGDLLLMVKPQFEVGKENLGSGGVVRDPRLHKGAIEQVVTSAYESGLELIAVSPSALPGPHGNREYFVWLRDPQTSSASNSTTVIPSRPTSGFDQPLDLPVAYRNTISDAVDSLFGGPAYDAIAKVAGRPKLARAVLAKIDVAQTAVYWVKRS